MLKDRARSAVAGALIATAAVSVWAASACRRQGGASTDPTPVPFANAAAGAGIRVSYGHPPELLSILETAGSGAGFLDFDRDGNLDILLVGTERCLLFRNNGNGTFSEATRDAGLEQKGHWLGCACADYDNDGYPDVFLNGYGATRLLHNEGGRSFRDVTKLAGLDQPFAPGTRDLSFGSSAAWGDVDRDSFLDLYVARYVRFLPGMEPGCPGRNGVRQTCPPLHYAPQFGSLYRNVAGRRFEDVTRRMGADRVHGKAWGLVFCDYDADGWPDLYVANDETPGDLLHNLGGKRFENAAVEAGVAYDADGRLHGAMGVDAGDYDGDGRMDLLVTAFVDEPFCLYRNNDGRTFTDQAALSGIALPTTPLSGWAAKLLDYDNDGLLDVLFVNGHAIDDDRAPRGHPALRQPMLLFHNNGTAFGRVPMGPLDAPIAGRGAAFADYDNDGFPDALVVDMEGPALLLHNEEGRRRPRAHWLGLKLTGRRSNRDGLGARVTLRASGYPEGARTRVAEAQTSGSVFSSNDPRVRFGLGSITVVDEVDIRWPGGTVDRLTNVPADRYVEVTEGSAPGR